MRPSRLLPAAALLLLVVGACAPLEGAAAPGSAAPTATPTAVVEQQRETGLVAPARPLGGDCANLLTVDEAGSFLGGAAVLSTGRESFAPNAAVELHGGLSCDWSLADGTYAASISVVLLAADAASFDSPTECIAESEEIITPTCPIEATVNGTRVSGWMYASPPASVQTVQSAVTGILALFEERANANPPAPVPLPALGAWAHPVDCAAVVAAGDLSSVSGIGASAVGMPFPFGGHAELNVAKVAVQGTNSPFPYCWIEGEAAEVTFVASGGGRWLESTVSATGTPFAIDGYESAYTTPGQDGLTKVDIFDGPNWLHFQIKFTSNAKPLADALFAGLDATAAS